MKRDMDLIRELLLRLEAVPLRSGSLWHWSPDEDEMQVRGYDRDQIGCHLELIRDAGYVMSGPDEPQEGISFRGLSYAGHDFLDSVRDPEVWAKTKKGAEAAGVFTMDLLKDLAKGFVKKKLEDHTGIKL